MIPRAYYEVVKRDRSVPLVLDRRFMAILAVVTFSVSVTSWFVPFADAWWWGVILFATVGGFLGLNLLGIAIERRWRSVSTN